VVAQEANDGKNEARRDASVTNRDFAGLLARLPRSVSPRQLERDLGARVADADDEDGAVSQLGRVAVRRGVELVDPRVELAGEGGNLGRPVRARGDDHVVRLEPLCSRVHDVAVARSGKTLDAHAGANGQFEARRVGLQVVTHLVLRREPPAPPRKTHPRQAVVLRRREQAKRVPTLTPRVADPIVRIEDQEGQASLL
jgi:hypothetical protein